MAALPPLERLIQAQGARTTAVEKKIGRIVPHVFHRDGEPIRSVRREWRAATKRAGLEGAWLRDLRRRPVRNLERAGVSRSVAIRLTGHKTENVYRRCAIADEDALRESVEKLARLHASTGTDGPSVVPIQVDG